MLKIGYRMGSSGAAVLITLQCGSKFSNLLTNILIVSAVNGRLHVLKTYQNAYDNTGSIESHIYQAGCNLAGAVEALKSAQQNHDCMTIFFVS